MNQVKCLFLSVNIQFSSDKCCVWYQDRYTAISFMVLGFRVFLGLLKVLLRILRKFYCMEFFLEGLRDFYSNS